MIMAGGTGGHVFPGLAVAAHLRDAGWRVVWLGSRHGMEAGLVPNRGYEMAWVDFAGLRGKGLQALILLPVRLLSACWQSGRAILRHRPDVVLGLGGYQSFPGGLVAALLRRPLVIHEQNSIAGLANRVLAALAQRVLAGFPGALRSARVVGNPVRPEIAALPEPTARFAGRSGPLRLLVIGGSLGAKALNDALPAALALLPEQSRPVVVHQAGRQHADALRAGYAAAGVSAEAVAFIDDMAASYAAADLVVCRAGALTVAELSAAGIASILVPFPYAVDDHQTGNARYLSDAGAAILLPQKELSAEHLAQMLSGLSRERLRAMAQIARRLALPGATAEVARECVELAA